VILGQFRGGFPWIPISLPLLDGGVRLSDFLLDSGFEGDLLIPAEYLAGLDAVYLGEHPFAMADSSYRRSPVYGLYVDWDGDERFTEAAVMESRPLVGIRMLLGKSVHMELTEGGGVIVEPL
jgi:predicted aspartyl protease